MKNYKIKAFIGIFLMAILASTAFAQVDVTRELPLITAAGETFTVTLNVDVDESNAPNPYSITETVPVGWTILSSSINPNNSVANGPLTKKITNNTLELSFINDSENLGHIIEDIVLTYQVTVPNGAVSGDYLFNGSVIIGSDSTPITGNNSVNIPLPPLPPLPVSVTRDLPASTVKNTTFTVTLNINVNESNAPASYGIKETVPVGWVISNVNPNNSVANGPLTKKITNNTLELSFINDSENLGHIIEDIVLTYQVTVPDDASETNFSFNGLVQTTAGNRSIGGDQSIDVVGDITPPNSTITSPANASYLMACTTINGTAADDNSGVQKVDVSINNGTWNPAVGTDPWSYNCSSLTDGVYVINSRATDNANNVENVSGKEGITITIDSTNPILNVTSPVSGSVWVPKTAPNIDVNGTVSDVNFASLTINVSGNVSTITTGGAFSQTKTLTLGVNHTITVTATDKAGNTASDTRTVKLCAKGDNDCNGAVNTVDFMYFAAAFGVTPAASWADFNNDGKVDNADFFAFAEAWTG